MNKVLVKVHVPSLATAYEIFVPSELRLSEMISYICNALEQYSEGQYCPSQKEILCEKQSGKVLDINYSAYELGIHNGSELVLI